MSPIVELSQPKDYADNDNDWTVLANNSRVNKAWEALMEQASKEHTKKYKDRGVWEYELPVENASFMCLGLKVELCSYIML